MTHLSISTPADFHYLNVVDSHGWRDVAPFQYDEATQTLTRLHRLSTGQVIHLTITGSDQQITAACQGNELTETMTAEIRTMIRRIFALEWDMSAFYTALRGRKHYDWIEAQRQGRLLVCPTVWEDLAKTLLTTNTTWAQTKNMARRLCAFGDELAGFGRTFPTPAQIAPLDAAELATATGMGYRAPHLIALAQKITRGELDVEAWAQRTLTADDLFKQVKALKGFGDYAAGTMLKLLGYFDRLAIDTVARAGYKRIMNSTTATDQEIHAYYADFGQWRGLAQWMDILRSDSMLESMRRAEG